jgi:hypothetical protein
MSNKFTVDPHDFLECHFFAALDCAVIKKQRMRTKAITSMRYVTPEQTALISEQEFLEL